MSLNRIKINESTVVNTGIVYDISKATGLTYETLSDALGTDGNNVPSEVREGGMSVRYVLISDNKYVQFRYMSSSVAVADFTNTANWQGVDDEPTDKSKNLVESGGVKKAIDENIEMFSERILYEELDYPILADGTFGTSQSKHAAIPVKAGDVRYLIAKVTSARYCFATSNAYQAGGQIPLVSGTSMAIVGINILLKITIPEGCSYLLFSAGVSVESYIYKAVNIDIAINKLQFDRLNGFDYSFPATYAYKSLYFGFEIPANTLITSFGNNDSNLYLIPKDGSPYLIQSGHLPRKISAPIIGFKPNSNNAGSLSIRVQRKSDTEFLMEEQFKVFGIDVSFENSSYKTMWLDRAIPEGTVLYKEYSGLIYLYDIADNEYTWTTAAPSYTCPTEISYFKVTTNGTGRIYTQSQLEVIKNDLAEVTNEEEHIKTDIGLYHCSIWGGQVNFGTGQLYNKAYNNYHFSDAIPIDEESQLVYCDDPNVERYMYFSDKPVIGDNSSIYIGYREYYNTNGIPSGTKYAVVVFADKYVPAVQPFEVYVDKIAYRVNFAKKMQNKKLVTIGDSLTQNCIWQPKVMRCSGMKWSFTECYSGLGYVNLNDGTYTTENKSSDPNYRQAFSTALYGSPIRPTVNNSIFMRSFDVKFYEPDIIFIYGGENDVLSNWKSTGNTGTTPDEVVANEVPYKIDSVDNSVSVIAAYKGMIENLMENCPNAIIYIITSMRVYGEVGKEVSGSVRFQSIADVMQWESETRYPKVEYMRAIAKYYNLPVIDLWNKSGINNYNAEQWYGETAADATQVHPDRDGYLRMADVMLQCL